MITSGPFTGNTFIFSKRFVGQTGPYNSKRHNLPPSGTENFLAGIYGPIYLPKSKQTLREFLRNAIFRTKPKKKVQQQAGFAHLLTETEELSKGGKVKAAAVIASILALGAPAVATDLQISVQTDKAVYRFGENVVISVTAYNPTDSAIRLSWGSSCQATYLMDGWFCPPWICLLVITSGVIAPNDSHTWTMVHGYWGRYECPLLPGKHSVVGVVIGYARSDPIEFEVEGPIPTIHVSTTGSDITGDGSAEGPCWFESSPRQSNKGPSG